MGINGICEITSYIWKYLESMDKFSNEFEWNMR